MQYVPARRISLKTHPLLREAWLHERIMEDPTVLGLGDLDLRDAEVIQPKAGRLDLLLVDPSANTRYEVEVQLGATDPSHIIRTIEYWDIERTRYPKYKHVAVIVAEDITSRFLNVIRLFNATIPIIAVQIAALEVDGKLTLSATKVLDLTALGPDEDEEPGPAVDRAYWDNRVSPASMALVDRLLQLTRELVMDDSIDLKYNKFYIGLARHGVADNFIAFHPRKGNWVLLDFRVARTDELVARLEDAKIDVASGYNPQRLHIRLNRDALDLNHDLIAELVVTAANVGPSEEPEGIEQLGSGETEA